MRKNNINENNGPLKNIIGIDIGTAYFCMGKLSKNSIIEIVQNNLFKNKTPNFISFSQKKILFGEMGKRELLRNPKNTIYNTKRLIGIPLNEIKEDMQLPFKIGKMNSNIKERNKPILQGTFILDNESAFLPEEILALNLKELITNLQLKSKPFIVLTVPSFFNQYQIKATKDSALMGLINVVGIIHETLAAALAYGYNNTIDSKKTLFVFDLGAGCLDLGIIQIDKNNTYNEIASNGCFIGGEDFDNILVDFVIDEIKSNEDIDINKAENINYYRELIKNACETAKKNLSFSDETKITLQFPFEGKEISTSVDLSKSIFEELCEDLFNKIMDKVNLILKEANLTPDKINEVLLVGGSSRIPKLKENLSAIFGENKINNTVDPDEGIAIGATIYSCKLCGELKYKDYTIISSISNDYVFECSDKHNKYFVKMNLNESKITSQGAYLFDGEQKVKNTANGKAVLNLRLSNKKENLIFESVAKTPSFYFSKVTSVFTNIGYSEEKHCSCLISIDEFSLISVKIFTKSKKYDLIRISYTVEYAYNPNCLLTDDEISRGKSRVIYIYQNKDSLNKDKDSTIKDYYII